MPSPITLMPQPKDLIPLGYHLEVTTTRCACGATHQLSSLYARNELRSRVTGGPVVHFVPVSRILYSAPITVRHLPPTDIPICHECAGSATFPHLPDANAAREWEATLARKAAQDAATAPASEGGGTPTRTPRPSRKSLDELLGL